MTTTWTTEKKYAGAPSTTYNDSAVTYSQANINYNGQTITTWTKETKS